MPGWDVLAGRAPERAAIDRLLIDLGAGRGRLVLVEGEAGIGKTRLCEHLLDTARAVADTAEVTCWESEAVPAFWPWQRLLTSVGTQLPNAARNADPLAARVTLFDAVTERLTARAATRPLVLVLDDAQWADELSRAYLRFVAPALRTLPVLVAAGVRTGEPAGDDLATTAGRHALRLRLTGLDRDDLAELVRATTGTDPSPEDVTALHERTAGNPLFAKEIAALPTSDEPLPATVRAVLERRIRRVADATRDLLDVAAVVGDEPGLDVLAATLGIAAVDCLVRLDDAANAGIVTVHETRATFAHPLLRSVLLDALGVAQRARLHQRVATALERLHDTGSRVPLAALAGHYAAAASAGSATEAVTYGVRAGDEAVAMLAYEQGARLYERALRCLDLAPAAHDRTDLLLRTGRALTAAGQPAKARDVHVAAANQARQAGDVTAFATAALAVGSGEGFEVTLFDAEQQALLAEAIDLVTDPALRARLVARLSVAESLQQPEERRRAAAEDALATARAAHDDEAVCDALGALCDAAAGPDDAELRIALATELVGLASSRNDPRRELLGRRLLVVAHLERGDVAATDAEIERYAAVAERLRSPLYSWYVPLWRGMRAAMAGDTETAHRRIDQAAALGRAASSGNAEMLVLTAQFFLGAETGELDVSMLDGLATFDILPVWLHVTKAYAMAALDRIDEARALLDVALPELHTVPRDSEYLAVLAQAAFAVSRCGGHPLATLVYNALLPHRHRFAIEGIGAYCHGSVERHLALLSDAPARQPETPSADGEFHRTGDLWAVGIGGTTAHVRDTKGMRDLATLLARPGTAVAARDLLGNQDSGGDLGDVIDATARTAYRRRLTDLEEEIDDADAAADLARGERARAERDALVAELTSAYGLGGRPRKAGDPAERARTAVTARIRDALRRIETADRATGAHLRRSVKTGTFCTYDPVSPVRWRL